MRQATCSEPRCLRPHHAQGLCSPHYRKAQGYKSKPPTPEVNAEAVLRRGGTLNPPRSLPFRVVARSCPTCGAMLTTPSHLLRKDAGPLPPCHACHIRRVRAAVVKRERTDEDFRIKQRRAVDAKREKANDETRAAATRAGYQWTGPELEIVGRSDLTARQVATMLGRSLYAVKHARRKLTDPKWAPIAGLPRQAAE